MNDPMTAYNMAQAIAHGLEKSFPATRAAVSKLRVEAFNDVRSATDLLNVIVDAIEGEQIVHVLEPEPLELTEEVPA